MRSAILAIGSLLWDDKEREAWRRSRLHLDERFSVSVPICYGRRARSRGKTFTITFAPDGRLGQGVLIPCRLPIDDARGLLLEAEALWKAEKPSARAGEIGAAWGCVGTMFREPDRLLEEWNNHFRGTRVHPVYPVNANGKLSIRWPVPTTVGSSNDIDVILVTATKAQENLPSPDEIADAWLCQADGHERYFFENVRHGIRTPDDGLIWERIRSRKPRWLAEPLYQEAIAVLGKPDEGIRLALPRRPRGYRMSRASKVEE